MTEPVAVPRVYAAIHEVLTGLSKEGIAKGRTNTFDQSKFRGIDDVYNVVSRQLAHADLLFVPVAISRSRSERPNDKKVTSLTIVEVTYRFIHIGDGSTLDIVMHAEGVDTSDKSTGKAMSYAYKQALFQALCIPIAGHNPDSDDDKPELPPKQPARTTPRAPAATNPAPASAASRAQSNGDRYKSYWPLFRNSSHVKGAEGPNGDKIAPFKGDPLASLDAKALAEYIVRLEKGLATQTEKAQATHPDARLYLAAAIAEHERREAEEAEAALAFKSGDPDDGRPF